MKTEGATTEETRFARISRALARVQANFWQICTSRSRQVAGGRADGLATVQEELQATDLALAAARLRVLNEQQSADGLSTLRSDLATMLELGIVDEKGNRIRKELPAEILADTCDV